MSLVESKVGQYFFSPDGRMGLQIEKTPLQVNVDGSVETRREWVKREASETPPRPENIPQVALSPNSCRVLEARYLVRDEQGKIIETPEELLWRVAYNVAMADKIYNGEVEKTAVGFYGIMANLEFLPNSPTLMNAGRGLQQLSACFVLPVEDNMISIMEAVKATALIHQSGGGTGFSFSKLRPEGSIVRSSGGVASGPLSFMEIFDRTTEQIKQGGKRRGANMATLRIDHPDIRKFITVKQEPGRLENFNLSVLITDDFMKAVETSEDYDLVNPHTGEKKRVKAKPIFKKIAEGAWRSGEPGVIFIDRINEFNPTQHLGEIESTNPCGEQPLHPYESCNLGSINLAKIVTDERIDWLKLERVTMTAVHFLDNVIDMNRYPLPETEKMTLANRRIGLGIMGLADMLIQLRVSYASDEGVEIARKVMRFIKEKGYEASEELAKERGVFPNWQGSEHQKAGRSMRNATITTIAPTGSIGLIADCSQGCEPYFALAFERRGLLDGETTLVEFNPYFLEVAERLGLSEEMMEEIGKKGRLGQFRDVVPDEIKRIFLTAYEVSPDWHLQMQAALQESTDNAVSKTINLPSEATAEDIIQAYNLAYKLGCKGVTVYRDGSREEQVLYTGEEKKEKEVKVEIRPRPETMKGETHCIKTPVGTAFITVNFNGEMRPFEVFIHVGKAGSDVNADAEALGRILSLFFRSQPKADSNWLLFQAVDQLSGIGGSNSVGFGPNRVRSLADAVAKVLESYLKKNGQEGEELKEIKRMVNICPDCGSATLVQGESCQGCRNCGYSVC